ncbi:MAG: SphA family protein [Pyrinomonadaceae bacterium]
MLTTSRKQTSSGITSHPVSGRIKRLSPRNSRRLALLPSLLLLILFASSGAVRAQFNIPIVRGDTGLKSGSQPGPGVYITGLVYYYSAQEIVDKDGTRFNRVSIDQYLPAAALTYVSKKKFLGGNYSATVVLPLLNLAIATPQSTETSGMGYSDTFVQPIQLGWHKKRYEAVAGYGVYIPTGRFTAGGSNNHGLGMWSHELSAGATVYLDEKKQWHAATLATYNIQSQIRGTNRKAGNVLSLEGGVGGTFCSGLCNVGVDYYTQWKVTDDKFANVTPNFLSKHRYYGIGPEVNGVIPINAKTLAVFKVAYFREFGNRVATQGQSIIMSVTLAKPKP